MAAGSDSQGGIVTDRKGRVRLMKPTRNEPKGGCFEENWASQLLREKGYAIDPPEIWSDGTIRRAVNDVPLTNREVVKMAARYPEWRAREHLFLDYLNSYQRSLTINAR
jgi:hypothetical protein